MVLVKITQLDHGKGLELPAYGTTMSAGCDLRAAIQSPITIPPGEWRLIPTGIAIELPDRVATADAGGLLEAQIRPRSGLAFRNGVTVLNSPGTIDADYRGEIKVNLINHGPKPFEVFRGDRIAQLVLAQVGQVVWALTDALSSTERGAGGFGSTGKE